MTARRPARRRRRRGAVQAPALPLLAVAAAALAILAVVDALAHAWPLLVAAAALGAYALGRRHGRAIPSPRPDPERVRLAAEVDRLAAELAAARESAALAWDAAAEQPPRRPADPGPAGDPAADRRAALLADPRSGARPLGRAS